MKNNEYHYIDRVQAISILQMLIGKPLKYIIKSPDLNLYDFGFGNLLEVDSVFGLHTIGEYTLHASSCIKVFWRNGDSNVYEGETLCEVIERLSKLLDGSTVKRITLSEKNDLWISFNQCYMVIVTIEDDEESWRLFCADVNNPHLIASNSWLCL